MTTTVVREPLYRTAPDCRTTFGDLAARVGADMGLPPDDEQRWILDQIFAENEPGVPASRHVGVIAPRQQIKTSTLVVAALTDLFVLGVPEAIWTAHQSKTSTKSYQDMNARIQANPEYDRLVDFRAGRGEELIFLPGTPVSLEFRARSGGSGRGFTTDRLTLDEALYLRAGDLGALLPTMLTRRSAQVRYGSSAGLRISEVLRNLRDRGRAGSDPRLTYVEYGSSHKECATEACQHVFGTEGCALDDRELWWQGCSALWCGRVQEDDIADLRRALPPAEFMREVLGWWEDPPVGGGAFDSDLWAAQADPSVEPGTKIVYAVATAPDRSWAAIGAAWLRPDGHTQVSLVDYKPNATWVDARIKTIGGGKPLLDTASRGLVTGDEMSLQEQAQAHNALYDGVLAGTVHHDDLPALNTSVRMSRWRPLGDTRVLDAGGDGDISPLRAVAHAAWSVNRPKPGGWMVSL